MEKNQARFKNLDQIVKKLILRKKIMSNNDIRNYLPHRYPFC
ncbi:MAG: hypothetical protein CM15mP63_0820 [Gammaproteobacteria bacterium]|nr:MAG: hypothetical protein CM15mP63_0820 [Gammaproteobacteria bacterium]